MSSDSPSPAPSGPWGKTQTFIKESWAINLDEKVISSGEPVWTNSDLEATPVARRNWGSWDFIAYWWGIGFANWNYGSALIGVGLNWWQALVTIFIAHSFLAIILMLNARGGARYHLGFPVIARMTFGMYGSFIIVGARALVAILWLAINTYFGAALIQNALRAMFSSIHTMPNMIPKSIGITSARLVAFIVFWLMHLPFTLLRPHQLRWLFTVKSFILPVANFGLFIFCLVKGKGLAAGTPKIAGVVIPTGAKLAWFMLYGINSGIGKSASYLVNIPDIARHARRPMDTTWPQFVALLFGNSLGCMLGILGTSAIQKAWGVVLWNQYDLLDAIMDRNFDAKTRCAVFLAASAFAFSTLGTNVAGNMISVGADLAMLWPKRLNMVRGQILASVLALCIFPWKIVASASTFVTFLGGYGVFMVPGAAVMMVHYYFVCRGNIVASRLYDGKKDNPYYYTRGVNWQGYLAYACGIAVPLPGFLVQLKVWNDTNALHVFYLGYLTCFLTAFFVYLALLRFFPHKSQPFFDALSFEQLADEGDLAEKNSTKFGNPSTSMAVEAEKDLDGDSMVDEDEKKEDGGGAVVSVLPVTS